MVPGACGVDEPAAARPGDAGLEGMGEGVAMGSVMTLTLLEQFAYCKVGGVFED